MAFEFLKNIFAKKGEKADEEQKISETSENSGETKEAGGEGQESADGAFDDELSMLLAEDSSSELTDVDYDYINDVSVYDVVRNDKEEVEKKLDEKRKEEEEKAQLEASKEKFSPVMAIILVVMIILVIVALVGFGMAVSIVGERRIEGDFEGDAISQNKRSVSAANYIYIDNTQPYGDRELSMVKMLVDSAATVFYFDGELDIKEADFSLVDDKGNSYAIDLASFANMVFEDGMTQVRFAPLKTGINAVKLTVRGLNTGNTAVFDVIFDRPVGLPKIAYLKDKPSAKYREEEFSVKVSYVEFSGAGSRVEYSIDNREEKNYEVAQKEKNNGKYLILKENTGEKLKLWEKPIFHTFDDGKVTLGRCDFKALNDISGETTILINNLYKKYKTDILIPVGNLPQSMKEDEEAKPVQYDIDNYKIVFEGLKKYDEAYYLVLHCEDTEIAPDPNDEYANRQEVLLDAQLVLNTGNGMELNLKGICTAAKYGTDMVFPINEMTADLIKYMPRESAVLDVDNIYIGIDDIKIKIDPKDLIYKRPYLRNQFETTIIDAFKTRLEYKAGERKLKDIEGFSALLNSTAALMDSYEPLEDAEDFEMTVQVAAMDIENDFFYAIVMESMKYKQSDIDHYFYRTHKIRGMRTGNSWTIDQDSIVS